jgi:excisionase family DNA binding protein
MKEYLSINELSEYIHMSSSTIYKKTSSRQIPYIKSGKKLLFKKEAIDEWLEKYSQNPIEGNELEILKQIKPR